MGLIHFARHKMENVQLLLPGPEIFLIHRHTTIETSLINLIKFLDLSVLNLFMSTPVERPPPVSRIALDPRNIRGGLDLRGDQSCRRLWMPDSRIDGASTALPLD